MLEVGEGLTPGRGQQTLLAAPLQLEDVEADEILQVHEDEHQRVELISQPEVCELHPVERRREDTELEREERRREELEKQELCGFLPQLTLH